MTKVKICGLRRASDARACAEVGVAFGGLNRVAGTRRAISDDRIGEVLDALGETQAVWLYRDAPLERILDDARAWPVAWVQLHGAESPELGADLREAGLHVIRATTAASLRDPEWRDAWRHVAHAWLVDGRNPGSGETWAWDALVPMPGAADGEGHPPLWLAGGLTPSNVAEAARRVRPAVVDVASGIERDGLPNAARIAAFTRAAHSEVQA